MSAEKDSRTNTIYIPLLNEGTAVIRPTEGISVGPRMFRVLETPDYDSEDEEWQFPPGSIVECEEEIRIGEVVLVAKRLVP